MISRIHQKLGTAGFIISIVALVAALSGAAIAANNGLTAKQKKQVKSIAQTEAKKVAIPGPAGPQGAPGANGTNGTNGAKGDKGDNGTSVTVSPASAGECPAGGSKFTAGSTSGKACNGNPAEFPGVLPSGKTVAGTWVTPPRVTGASTQNGENQYVALSFTIPMATAPTKIVWNEEESTDCPGTVDDPEAAKGVVCVYVEEGAGGGTTAWYLQNGFDPGAPLAKFQPKLYVSGATFYVNVANLDEGPRGTWAATAP